MLYKEPNMGKRTLSFMRGMLRNWHLHYFKDSAGRIFDFKIKYGRWS